MTSQSGVNVTAFGPRYAETAERWQRASSHLTATTCQRPTGIPTSTGVTR